MPKLKVNRTFDAAKVEMLKALVKKLDEAMRQVGRNSVKVWRTTYEVIGPLEGLVRGDYARRARVVADTVKRHSSTINNWYRSGALIVKHNLPDTACAHSIRVLGFAYNRMSPAAIAGAIALINNSASSRQVSRFVAKHCPTMDQRGISKRISNLVAAGRLTEQRLKLECMALATLASRFFEVPAAVAITDEEGNVLMGTDETIVHRGSLTRAQLERIIEAMTDD